MLGPSLSKVLLVHGTVLFMLGLLNGLAVQRFKNPRMALSAHLAAMQNGMVLWAFGLIWPHTTLGPMGQAWVAFTAVPAMYAIWLALLLAAILGTSRSTPIAGVGHAASARKEFVVAALLAAGSLGIIVATLGLLWGVVLIAGVRATPFSMACHRKRRRALGKPEDLHEPLPSAMTAPGSLKERDGVARSCPITSAGYWS